MSRTGNPFPFRANGSADMQGALSLSRAEMDFRLMEKAKKCGVNVLEETSVNGVLFENDEVHGVKVKTKDGETREVFSDLTIDATGRANVLAKLAFKKFSQRSQSRKESNIQKSKIVLSVLKRI